MRHRLFFRDTRWRTVEKRHWYLVNVALALCSPTLNDVMMVGCSALSSSSDAAASRRTNSSGRVALITGGNKGIGKEIARLLAGNDNNNGDISTSTTTLITSRDAARGEAAVAELTKDCSSKNNIVKCISPFDLTDVQSIRSAAEWIENEYGRLDVLVNNAAVCFNDPTLCKCIVNADGWYLYACCVHFPRLRYE